MCLEIIPGRVWRTTYGAGEHPTLYIIALATVNNFEQTFFKMIFFFSGRDNLSHTWLWPELSIALRLGITPGDIGDHSGAGD